jgi:D-alanyl-lipoteichoic acid acyltransferase DltB (MBOAT superfamily)
MSIQNIVLPLGISFFTFQQIAYLVDVYHSETEEHRFDHYLLFVTFFPQLIAGPIVHHKEMMPQLVHALAQRITINKIALGVAIFSVGLFKKVMIADRVALYATPVFDASASGIPVPFIESWLGVIAYTFQIYFDFSAYSEMAIGLGLLFGLKLPINFLSPYKATSLIDFWRRWHITLSRFLRDYLYIPLGGGHNGERSRYINLLSVMILGGLWHGAAWNFVIWGSLHGVGLAINHGWRQLITPNQKTPVRAQTVKLLLSWLITFLFVTVTWVFFRASNFESAIILLKGMAGFNGFVLPDTYFSMLGPLTEILIFFGVQFEKAPLFLGIEQIGWLGVILLITMLLPNIPQWARYETSSQRLDPDSFTLWSWTWFSWQPNIPWAIGLSAISLLSLVYMADAGEFLYFQF